MDFGDYFVRVESRRLLACIVEYRDDIFVINKKAMMELLGLGTRGAEASPPQEAVMPREAATPEASKTLFKVGRNFKFVRGKNNLCIYRKFPRTPSDRGGGGGVSGRRRRSPLPRGIRRQRASALPRLRRRRPNASLQRKGSRRKDSQW